MSYCFSLKGILQFTDSGCMIEVMNYISALRLLM